MRAVQISGRALALVAASFLGLSGALGSEAELGKYRISPGDRLELKVVGLPELSQNAIVDVAGNVPLPMLGSISVGGLTLAEIQDKVRVAFSGKIVYRRSPDGKKVPHIPDANEILLEVAEYRPVYIGGDVPRGGEQPFRPGMRVRHVLALAGGQDALSSRVGAGMLNAFDYRSSRDSGLLEYARERLQFWRLTAELADQSTLPTEDLLQRLPHVAGVDMVVKSEAEILALRSSDWAKEKLYLQQAIDKATVRLDALADQFKAESKGSIADATEFERMQKLMDKNLTVQTRVTDARRAMLISATRALQIGVQVATAERDREERVRALVRAIDNRRTTLMKERDDASLRIVQIGARVNANDRKLVFLTGIAAAASAEEGPVRRITISRSGPDGVQAIVADEDTPLRPGDTVEVRVKQSVDLGRGDK